MRTDVYERLAGALGRNPEFDLPSNRRDFLLLAAFLDENPGFDTNADDETLEKLWTLQGTDRDVFVPEDDDALGLLIDLLQRHDDLDVLAKLLQADDPDALLSALGHGTSGASGGTRHAGAAGEPVGTGEPIGTDVDEDDGNGGWFSDDDEESDLLDHENLDAFGERLSYVAGGLVCLVALLATWFQGFTIYRDVDSWILSIEVPNSEVVLLASAVAALVLGVVVGFVYRAFTDDVHEDYRQDLAAALFEVPLMVTGLFLVLYLLAPIVLNAVHGLLGEALVYTVGLAIVLVVFGTVLLAVLGIGIGLVVGLPAYVGVVVGTLLGSLVRV